MSAKHKGRRSRRAAREQNDIPAAPPVWPGLSGGRYRPLSDAEEAQSNETVLSLLEDLGLSQAIPSMIEKVTERGGKLGADGRLRFPRELVQWAIDGARRVRSAYRCL